MRKRSIWIGSLLVVLALCALAPRWGPLLRWREQPYDPRGLPLVLQETYGRTGMVWTGLKQGFRTLVETDERSMFTRADTLDHVVAVLGSPDFAKGDDPGALLWRLDLESPKYWRPVAFLYLEVRFDGANRASWIKAHKEMPKGFGPIENQRP